MVAQFGSANRTKSLFSMIDAGRPQAAQQKLGGIMGSQSVLANQANAQTAENKQVTDKTQDMANNVGNYDNLEGYKSAGQTLQAGNKLVGGVTGTPTLVSSVQQGGIAKSVQAEGDMKKALQSNVDKNAAFQKAAGDLVKNTDTTGLTDELNKAYQGDVSKLQANQDLMTKGNLGVLAGPSQYEIDQAKTAQLLADNQSNIGKLNALYGGGYDSTKYGALDSNLLQGQFNEAQGKAKQGLANVEEANKQGENVRKAYLDQVKTSQDSLGKNKQAADENIKRWNTELAKLKAKLTDSMARSGGNVSAANQKLKEQYDALLKKKTEFEGDQAKEVDAQKGRVITNALAGAANDTVEGIGRALDPKQQIMGKINEGYRSGLKTVKKFLK